MPVLGGLFVGLFVELFKFFGAALGRKLGVVAAFVASSSVIVTVTVVAMKAALTGLVASMPAGFSMGAWLFVPDNAGACVAVCLLADGAVAVMGWWRSNLHIVAQIAGGA